MKLATITLASLALAGLLCYGALRTAQAIAAKQQQQIERTLTE